MIQFREAQDMLIKTAHSFGVEQIPLEQAGGRILAEKLHADRDYPPFNRATMDGYAIRLQDLNSGIRQFEVAETILAGSVNKGFLREGQCYKIMTGAPVPGDADHVIRREDTEEGDEFMRLREEFIQSTNRKPFQNIARKGEDLLKDAVVIDAPCRCEPAVIGLLASLGKADIIVSKQPSISLITTGNEVVGARGPVSASQIRNSNRWLITSLLSKAGLSVGLYNHAADTREAIRHSLMMGLPSDLVILTGGVSAGDADFVPEILGELGVKKLFHKLAIKPGKPAWCGIAPTGAVVVALPGNPFSCLVGYHLLIAPWLDACFGLSPLMPIGLPLRSVKKKVTPLDEFFPVRIAGAPARVETLPINGSGDVRMGLFADALALHPAGSGDLAAGDMVQCLQLR